ncbi:MAG TPA: hypothetical protein VHO25_05790, partial [Polyangiaceae bacterium]|nr:hypothetical protein [Polyangiaceae bacterium]
LVDEQTPIAGQFALIAVKIRLDGKDLAFEDVDDLDDDDVAELVQIVMGQRKSDDEIAAAKALAEAQKSDAPKGDGNNEQAPASGSTSGS